MILICNLCLNLQLMSICYVIIGLVVTLYKRLLSLRFKIIKQIRHNLTILLGFLIFKVSNNTLSSSRVHCIYSSRFVWLYSQSCHVRRWSDRLSFSDDVAAADWRRRTRPGQGWDPSRGLRSGSSPESERRDADGWTREFNNRDLRVPTPDLAASGAAKVAL